MRRSTRYLSLAVLLLGLAVAFLWQRNGRLREERDRYRGNTEALLSDMKRIRVDSTTMAVDVNTLRLRVDEYKRLRAEYAEKIKRLGVKIKNLEAASRHEVEVAGPIDAVVRDTVVIRDTVPILRQKIEMLTPHIQLTGIIEDNRLKGEILEIPQETQAKFRQHLSEMTDIEYRKEMERLGIDLSWKSSQIEGNTYSLLETERLLKEKQTANGKTKEEAVMLLNHKDTLDFILDAPDYLKEISVGRIEEIHALLIKELGVERNIRHRRVGITGTNYRPLDNEFQIREALEDSCRLINGKSEVFEKSLLALVLLSYIQAFTDGNKRTARITANGILIANGYCPISFRSVDSIDYKKAMLMFYEQNNIAAFKRIFIEQFLFAVNTYF